MAEFNSKGERLISIVRVLEYHGTDEWIRKTMEASRIPWQGAHKDKLPEGCEIKSGLVVWNIESEITEDRTVIPIPPGSQVQ